VKDKPWHLDRRTMLSGLGVACCLPFFEAMTASVNAQEKTPQPRRLLNLYVGNGVSLPPHEAGSDYKMTKVMEPLKEKRDQFTIFGGLSHPKSRSLLGHTAGDSWLTGGDVGGEYNNTISLWTKSSPIITKTRLGILS